VAESFELGEGKSKVKEKATIIELPKKDDKDEPEELTGKARLMEKLKQKRDENFEK